ncbi:LptA/OstA family protein [Fulvimarina sp. 2208YS6-2-32]|uniref:LptA/OstA family protein n=1 Tax=Fulvimarina uroteuthidis TaxID=3098149 RepID=A0ABU5HZD7_9HYPH|nr:LptA/OstA family protein [Fulvimarina sp. 2208YS6-2-32]MDY8108123.1 LptA/OstA family protein [Fulvimarina sp. 2208YS6-2-32]
MRLSLGIIPAALIVGASLALPLSAAAQEGGFGSNFNGLQLDGDQPISIESSTLDVDDKAAIATFTGNVSVSQGPTLLKTGKLVVHYKNAGAADGSEGSGSLPGGSSAIERLEATENVYVKSEDQVATAQRASFDMAADVVVMTGDVVLSQGENVAEGCRLTIQMGSGRARLESSNCDGNSGGGGRVRMMLTPGSN